MLLNEDPAYQWYAAPSKVYGLDNYPYTAQGLADTVHFMVDKIGEMHATSPIKPKTVTAFVTEDHLSAFTSIAQYRQPNVQAVVLVYENLPDDVMYYVSAYLRADAFVHRADTNDRPIFGLWDRCSGLSALIDDGARLSLIDPSSVSELLPPSVKGIVVPSRARS